MKKILVRSLLALAVLGVVGLVATVLFIDRVVKTGVETVGPVVTKTTVTLDRVGFNLLGGRMTLGGLAVGNPEGFKTPTSLQVGEIVLQVKPGSVLSDVIEIDEITIQAPQITYEQALTGNNLGKLLANVNAAVPSSEDQPADPPAEPASTKRFKVKLVRVEGAQVNLSATLLGGNAVPIPLPPLILENLGTSGNGLTAGELTSEILKRVLAGVTVAVAENVKNSGGSLKDAAGNAAEKAAEKAGEGLKNLFKK